MSKIYNLKLIKSGKRLEIYIVKGYVIGDKGNKVTGDIFEIPTEEKEKGKQTVKDRKTTLNNARNNIIRLIKANEDMQVFITLTFKEDSNYKDSKLLLNNLFNKLRKDYKNLKYLWVLEYGSLRGRLHYHVLTNISISIKLSTSKEKKSLEHRELENNFRERYWIHGWVDIRHLGQEDITNTALYVAAYITKDLIGKQLEGYRIYGYSRKTLIKPIEEKIYTTESLEKVLEQYKESHEIKYTNSYKIGYKTSTVDYTGIVSYFDLIKKEE